MSWSLQLRNGDLAVDGARLGQVTGTSKLIQDLRCALLEQRGNDDMHPTYGSLLEGGIDDHGNIVPSVIGQDSWERAAMMIESEIRRIAADHQQRQLTRAQQDRVTYGESTLSRQELLVRVSSIQMLQIQDSLVAVVHIETGEGNTEQITVPVSTEPLITL